MTPPFRTNYYLKRIFVRYSTFQSIALLKYYFSPNVILQQTFRPFHASRKHLLLPRVSSSLSSMSTSLSRPSCLSQLALPPRRRIALCWTFWSSTSTSLPFAVSSRPLPLPVWATEVPAAAGDSPSGVFLPYKWFLTFVVLECEAYRDYPYRSSVPKSSKDAASKNSLDSKLL